MKFSRLFLGLFIASIFIFPQTSFGATLGELQNLITEKQNDLKGKQAAFTTLPTASTTERVTLQGIIATLQSEVDKLQKDYDLELAKTNQSTAQTNYNSACGTDEVSAITNAGTEECKAATAQKQQADADAKKAEQAKTDAKCSAWSFFTPSCILEAIGSIFDSAVSYVLGGIILTAAGALLDYSVYFSVVKFADIVGSSAAGQVQTSVYSIWIFIRNLFNIIIVFELLYLSIAMIWKGYDESSFKSRLIAALVFAIGINFSFYFTKVLIDFSNITTLQIYSAINPQGDIGSISGHFMAKMNTANDFNNFSQGKNSTDQAIAGLVEPFVKGLFLLTLTGVFLSLALVFVKRGVMLIFLLILSPLMFAEFAGVGVIKSVSGWSKKWWKALTDELFMAPLTMLMIYLVLRIMSSGLLGADMFGGTTSDGFLINAATTGAAIIGTLIKYLVLAALATGAIKIARQFSNESSKAVQDKIDKAGGFVFGGALGAGAWALRRTVGKGAADRMSGEWADSKRDRAAQGGLGGLVARTQLKTVEGLSKSSLDIRNTDFVKDGSKKMGISSLLGNAKDGGFVKDIEDDKKKKEGIFADKLKYTQKDTSKMDTSTAEGRLKKLQADATNAARAQQLRASEALSAGAPGSPDQIKAARDAEQKALEKLTSAKSSGNDALIADAEESLKRARDARSKVEGSKMRGALASAVNLTAPGAITGGKSYGQVVAGEYDKNNTRTVGKAEDATEEKIKGSVDKANEALEKAKKTLLEKKAIEKNQKAADRVALALLADRGDWHQEIGNEDEFKKLESEFKASGAVNDKKAAEKMVEKQVAELKTSLSARIPLSNADGSQVVDDQGNVATREKTQEEKASVRKQIGLLNLAKKRLGEVEKKYTEVAEEKKDDKPAKDDEKK